MLNTKHFPGRASDGRKDAHFDWGKGQEYPGGRLEDHLKPFQAAIDAGTSAIMPYYAIPMGTEYEEVGFAFNRGILTQLLREKMGFRGSSTRIPVPFS
ncbi:MAG: glycoside hydrolase family 3 N-terminal domain-containing protein [Bacteroidales bacterium]